MGNTGRTPPVSMMAPIAPLESGFDAQSILMALLYIPFVLWGAHLLRQRMRRHLQASVRVQGITTAAVGLFTYVQCELVAEWLSQAPIKCLVAILGVLVAAAVLYGHVVVSLLSHAVMMVVMPLGGHDHHGPDLRAAQELERQGDLQGVRREYERLRREHPSSPAVLNGLADVLMRLDEPAAAVGFIEQALDSMPPGEAGVIHVLRLAEIYERRLGRPHEARRVLQRYLDRHPDTPREAAVQRRLSALGGESEGPRD